MRIFLDANIIVSVLLKEYPLFEHSSRILSLADNPKFSLYTSPVCLAIAFYFVEKKTGSSEVAKKKITLLQQKLNIAGINAEEVRLAIENKKVHDFEDGMQYYAALKQKCTVIVTEDTNDFYYAEIPVLQSAHFLREHVFS